MTINRILATLALTLMIATLSLAEDTQAIIASAESAAPASIAKFATIKNTTGTVLRQGSNGYTCYPQQEAIGPMCNEPIWDQLIKAMMNKTAFSADRLSVSYMLAGEGTAKGVSNKTPYASEPTADNDWVKEGPHLMIAVPDPAMLEGLSTNPADPVYVMWKGTPYAHIMVKVGR